MLLVTVRLVTVLLVTVLVVGAGVLVVGAGALVVGAPTVELRGVEWWLIAAILAGALVEFVRVKTSTSRSRGLDHITRWALRKE